MKNTIYILFIALLISSCITIKPIAPNPKQTFGIPKIEESFINVPISIDLNPAGTYLNSQIKPNLITALDAWNCDGHDCFEYEADRSPILISVIDNTFTFRTTVNYQARYGFKMDRPWPLHGYWITKLVSCGFNEEKPTVSVQLTSSLNCDKNYFINSKTSSIPITGTPCNVTIFKKDVRPIIIPKLQKIFDSYLNVIDQKIPEITNFKPKADEIWTSVQKPIKINDSINLFINPDTILVSPIKGANNIINFSLGLKCSPKLYLNSTDTTLWQVKKLPLLDIVNKEDSGFHIELDGKVSFKEASQVLNGNVKHKLFKWGPFKVVVKDAQIYGVGDTAIVKLKIRGSVKGILYLEGIPYYDTISKTIKVKNFNFSKETNNILLNLADWLLHNDFKEMVNAKIQFPIGAEIDKSKSMLNQAINRKIAPNISLIGNISNILPIGVFAEKNDFNAILVANGKIRVQVDK